MKNTVIALFLISAISLKAELFVFDYMEAVVLGKNTDVITYSDRVDKKNLAGQYENLDRLIRNFTLVQQAADEKMPIEDDIADKFLEDMVRRNQIQREGFDDVAAHYGLTLPELKSLLERSEVLRRFEGQRFYSRLAVTEGMIEAEYNAEPLYKEAWCKIKVA